MAMPSLLRLARTGFIKVPPVTIRNAITSIKTEQQNLVLQVRHGHGRTIQILPSRFEYRKFADHVHFYFWLGAIPLALITAYANVFIGQAELADIPEGYEPKHWEYYKHPVSRFFSKHLHENPQKQYEINLHYINLEQEKIKMRKLQQKVQSLIQDRGDYQAWYYVPYNADHVYRGLEDQERNIDLMAKK